ncbi:TPA: hypothetical protein SAF90_001709 [Campylobacter jejuni]|nr:hypothetical protein [Campylobacter jejuni]HEF5171385.1 hypothetical protein [Campylobacter jejuni]
MKKILILILVCFSLVSADNIEDEAIYKFLKCSHGDVNSCKKDYQNFLAWFKQKDQIVYGPKSFGCDRNYLLDMKKDIEKAIRLTFLKEAKFYDDIEGIAPVDIRIWMTCDKSYNLGNQKLIAGRITLDFESLRNYKWRYIEYEQVYLILGNDTSDLKTTIEDCIAHFGNIITNTAKAINQ